ncbi:AI-2E family transporter [Nocardiopsis kunsanensis]|uniref:AI-2E family transporter n=1 Tax=Nocardiopsis kunsanensis TaxID=141693 RepID=UPI000344DD58|nr:AI-2E family transporter [Nocardiopsis kunsanensis]
MQAQRPGVWALLKKWLEARRARAERRKQLEAEEAVNAQAEARKAVAETEAEDDVGAEDLLRSISDASWRVLIIGVVIGLLLYGLAYIWVVTLPVIIAVFITALLMPLVLFLRRKGLGRGLSTTLAMVTALVVLSGVVSLIVTPAMQGFGGLVASVSSAVNELRDLQVPFGLDPRLFTELIDQAWVQIQSTVIDNQSQLVSGALTAGSAVVQVLIGLILAIVLTVYFLHAGDKLMDWFTTLLPPKSRPGLRHAGKVAYDVMGRYVRGVAMVGLFDAFFIGIVLLIVLEPSLAIPLIVLTFVGAFLPVIGAFATGILAALVTFVAEGWVAALVVTIGVIVVQQLESNLFAPRIYGQALELPSAVVLLAISIGAIVGNVPGMFLATPIAAVVAALLRNRSSGRTDPHEEERATVEDGSGATAAARSGPAERGTAGT